MIVGDFGQLGLYVAFGAAILMIIISVITPIWEVIKEIWMAFREYISKYDDTRTLVFVIGVVVLVVSTIGIIGVGMFNN